jgi:hypothetical protein
MRTYYRKSYDVAGYTHTAEMLCLGCTASRFSGNDVGDVEAVLDAVALERGINRQDEHSYDSDDFPKVVFVDQLGDGERCDSCGSEL